MKVYERGRRVLSFYLKESGGDSEEVPPVPIPNTEVKLFSVDNTWWVTAREGRSLPERKTVSGVDANPFRGFVFLESM